MKDAERIEDRYRHPDRAAAYARRSPARHRAEMRVLDRALGRLPPGLDILDAPAGTGRVSRHLEAVGHRVVSADISPAMLRAETVDAGRALVADVLRLPFPDASFEAVLCMRFLYHLEGAGARARLLEEAARVSRKYVLVSLRHPVSLHAATRRFKAALRGRFRENRATSIRRLAREASRFGLEYRASDAEAPFRKEFWLATFEKR